MSEPETTDMDRLFSAQPLIPDLPAGLQDAGGVGFRASVGSNSRRLTEDDVLTWPREAPVTPRGEEVLSEAGVEELPAPLARPDLQRVFLYVDPADPSGRAVKLTVGITGAGASAAHTGRERSGENSSRRAWERDGFTYSVEAIGVSTAEIEAMASTARLG